MKIYELSETVPRLRAYELDIIENDNRQGIKRLHRPWPIFAGLSAIVVKPGEPVERHGSEYHGDYSAIRNAMVPAHLAVLDVFAGLLMTAISEDREPYFRVRHDGGKECRRWFGIIDFDMVSSGVVHQETRDYMWRRVRINRVGRVVEDVSGELFHPRGGLLAWFELMSAEAPF